MGSLQDDKKVLDTRKNKIEDAEADLRDRIPKKLFNKLKELNFAQKMREVWQQGSAERATWISRQQEYLGDWDEFLENAVEGPFEGSSNLHIPMSFTICKAYHARMVQALTADDFSYPAKARREDYVDREELVRETIRYTLKDWCNYNRGVHEALDRWVWDWVTTGLGLKKWRWEKLYERYEDVEDQVVPATPFVKTDEKGNENFIQRFKIEQKEVTKTVEIFNGPTLEVIALEDVFWKGHTDPSLADVTQHRQWLTASELWTLVDRGIFDEEAVKKVIAGGRDTKLGSQNSEMKVLRALNEGSNLNEQITDLDRYEILECYARLDVNDSGINSEIVGWVSVKTGELLRASYLRRISKAGRRPFVRADFIRTSHHEFPKGLPEILHPLQVETDSLRNMRVDFGILSVTPFGFYRASSSIEKEDLVFQPGSMIAVDNPQTDVYFPNLGNRTFFGQQEEQSINAIVERLTGINDVTLGSLSSQQGVTRTASGVRALVSESNANLNVHLRRLNEGWKQSLQILFYLLQERIPEGLAFRVTGLDGGDYFAQIKHQQALAGDYDFEISPNSETSNTAVRIDTATQVLQNLLNPINIQLGLVGPQQIYEAQKNYLQSIGVKDYSRYIMKPQQMVNRLLPNEEFQRVIRGIDVPITPEMDHQGYLDYFKIIVGSDELLGQFDEQSVLRAAKQAQGHMQMIQAMEALAAQQRNRDQLSINTSQGVNAVQPMGTQAAPQTPIVSEVVQQGLGI